MILIVESGSTKADWVLLHPDGTETNFRTKGWIPLFLTNDEMLERLNSYKELGEKKFTAVYFYTAGVSAVKASESLHFILSAFFSEAHIHVESDMLAAARGVYNHTAQFVAILGTGSNMAFFDGEELEQLTPSLGYVLGDEASGASLGKVLLRAYLYKSLPKDLYLQFSKVYSVSKDLALQSVYNETHPNWFLASFVPFLVEHQSHPYVQQLVRKEFYSFLKTHVLSHPLHLDYSISFVGSVAFLFQEIMSDLCKENKLQVAGFKQSPIHGLISYHKTNK
jgi:glucosamine kinase